MQLLQPEGPRSEYEALWLSMIGQKLDEGWRVAYSDGCGRDNHNSFACHKEDRRGGDRNDTTTGGYLGPITTVADSERRGVLEALQTEEDMLLVLRQHGGKGVSHQPQQRRCPTATDRAGHQNSPTQAGNPIT